MPRVIKSYMMCGLLILSLFAFIPQPSVREKPPEAKPDIGLLVSRLSHRRFGVRKSATDDLARHADWEDFPHIGKLYRRARHPEIRLRIRRALRRSCERRFRFGSLGIKFRLGDGDEDTDCIRITRVLPDSPAKKCGLRRGDLIRRMGSFRPTADTAEEDVTAFVRSLPEGTRLPITVATATTDHQNRTVEMTAHISLADPVRNDYFDTPYRWSVMAGRNRFNRLWKKHFGGEPPQVWPESWKDKPVIADFREPD